MEDTRPRSSGDLVLAPSNLPFVDQEHHLEAAEGFQAKEAEMNYALKCRIEFKAGVFCP